ncbi:MAG: hypothetical protein JXX28_12390 [Deltaproteobacteria bacterium]|nr:hypothetical protein [Deltaproteobacteria bacterium]
MLLITLLFGCSLFTGAPEDPGTADTAETPVPHPCEVEGRAVSWVQAPVDSESALGAPVDDLYYTLADDFVVPQEDGCWCVKEIRLFGQGADGALYDAPISVHLVSSESTGGPSHTVPDHSSGHAFAADGSLHEADGAIVLHPTNEGPGDPSEGYVLIGPGKFWLAASPWTFFVDHEGFAWSAGVTPEWTETAWVRDPDQVLTEVSCPDWAPWSECSPSSTARDLAFEIHATTDEAACQAWLASNGYTDESGVSE